MLTDSQCRTAKPQAKPYKLHDEKGLHLLVQPTGTRSWKLKYRSNGREQKLTLGPYPEIRLKQARALRDQARSQLAQGIDPTQARRQAESARENTFQTVSERWIEQHASHWSPDHLERVRNRLARNLLPWIGTLPVHEIKAPDLLACLRRVQERGAIETAHRARADASSVFRFAISCGLAERDPAADLRGALPPIQRRHFPAVTDPTKVGELLRVLQGYQGTLQTRNAMLMAPYLFQRPGELRSMRWADLDLDKGLWSYTVSKTRTEHLVPLSRQARALLQALQPLTGSGEYVFASPTARGKHRPISENTLNAALRRLGIDKTEMVSHGWRAIARTLLDEVLGERVDLIEQQLAHAVRDPLGRSYNRTRFVDERVRMMQRWADYLDGLRDGNVVLLKSA